MRKTTRQRGSAMILATIITIMVVGIGGAILVETAFRGKRQNTIMRSDEALGICDVGLELTRLTIKEWRNFDPMPSQPPALGWDQYAWGMIFDYCINNDLGTADGTIGPKKKCVADPQAIQANYMALYKKYGPSLGPTAQTGNNVPTLPYSQSVSNPSSPNPLIGFGNSQNNTLIGRLFCTWRVYGNGAYWVQMRNNNDTHGDGVDRDLDGDPWNVEGNDPNDTNGSAVPGPGYGVTPTGTHSDYIDGDRQAELIITACLPDGTYHQIEALVQYPQRRYTPAAALLDNGNIQMNGAFDILGAKGVVQANENLTGNGGGQANISVSANASGTASGFSMNNTPPQGINSGVAPASIPQVDDVHALLTAPELSPYYNNIVVFDAAGNAFTNGGSGQPVYTTPAGRSTNYGFSGGGGSFSASGGASIPSNIYFFNGNVSMQGQGNAAPYNMSIIATGSVSLLGNAKFSAFTPPNGGPPTNTLVVAGQDVELGGTGGLNLTNPQYAGSILAVEQVFMHGNFTLNGAVIGENLRDTPGSLVTTSTQLSPDATVVGHPTINYNGNGTFLPVPAQRVKVISVRQTR